jgi:hypothetical protein
MAENGGGEPDRCEQEPDAHEDTWVRRADSKQERRKNACPREGACKPQGHTCQHENHSLSCYQPEHIAATRAQSVPDRSRSSILAPGSKP